MRGWLIGGAVLTVATALLLVLGLTRWEPTGPDVILVTLDGARVDHLSLYGYGKETTPVLDELAESGLVFEGAYSPATLSVPAHASIMTGLRPLEHGALHNGYPISSENTTIAQRLQASGWETGAFVGTPLLGEHNGFNRGFDDYELLEYPNHYHAPLPVERALATFQAGAEWIRARDETPFFLWVHAQNTHFDFMPPLKFDRFRDLGDYPEPAYSGLMCVLHFTKEYREGRVLPDERIRATKARLDGEIAAADHGVGFLLQALEETGRSENAIVIVVGDHGVSLLDRADSRRTFHPHMIQYEEVVHAPLLMRLPNRQSGRIPGYVHIEQIHETIAGLTGLPERAGIRAHSLLSAVDAGSGANTFPELVWPPYLGYTAVRDGDWKLMADKRGARLFNLVDDPGETDDVAHAHPEVVARLQTVLDENASRYEEAKKQRRNAMSPEVLQLLRRGGYLEPETPTPSPTGTP